MNPPAVISGDFLLISILVIMALSSLFLLLGVFTQKSHEPAKIHVNKTKISSRITDTIAFVWAISTGIPIILVIELCQLFEPESAYKVSKDPHDFKN